MMLEFTASFSSKNEDLDRQAARLVKVEKQLVKIKHIQQEDIPMDLSKRLRPQPSPEKKLKKMINQRSGSQVTFSNAIIKDPKKFESERGERKQFEMPVERNKQ